MAETGTGQMMVPLVPCWQFEGAKNSSCATWRGSTVVPEFLNKWPIVSCFLSDVFRKFLQLDLFSMLFPEGFLRIFVKLPLTGVKWHDPPPRKQVPSLGTMSTSNSTSVTKRRDDDTVFLAKFSPAIFMEGLNLRSCAHRPSASVGFRLPSGPGNTYGPLFPESWRYHAHSE